MPVIDVQVHPFDRNHPGRPWAGPSHGLASATGEEMVAAMNSVGGDGAIMVSSLSAYEGSAHGRNVAESLQVVVPTYQLGRATI